MNISGPNSGSFVISNAAVSDSGSYSVVIANSGGSVTSAVVRADVFIWKRNLPIAQNNFDNSREQRL